MILTVTLNPATDKVVEAPEFEVGAHARVEVRTLLPAGKGINVARGLVRLGGRAIASGFIGRNEQALYEESLAADGVQARFCTVAGRTRTNTTILDPARHTNTHLREPGFTIDEDDLVRLCRILDAEMAGADSVTLVFAGSLPPGLRAEEFAGLLKHCHAQGAQIVLDTSGPPLRHAVATGLVHTLAPNLHEVSECLGRDVAPGHAVEAGAELLRWTDTVLLTLGADGAYAIRKAITAGRRCPVEPDRVRNTVGCGDAFLAGWLRGCQLESTPQQALRWAVAAGAASAMSETTVGYTLQDVERLLERCEPIG